MFLLLTAEQEGIGIGKTRQGPGRDKMMTGGARGLEKPWQVLRYT